MQRGSTARSASKAEGRSQNSAERGHEMEARVAQLWFWEGYFARRGINLERHYHPDPLLITDLDLMAFDFNPQLARTKHIGEVKTGTSRNAKPLDRLIWLSGLRQVVEADSGELTTAITPSDRVRSLGRSLGITTQSLADFERREKDAVAELDGLGSHGIAAAETTKQVQVICKRDPELERAFWFLRSEIWFLKPFVAVKQTLDLMRRLSRRWTPRLEDDDSTAIRWLISEAASVFTLNAVTIAGLGFTLSKEQFSSLVVDSLSEGIVPSHQARRFSESVDRYVAGLLAAAEAPAQIRVDAVGAFYPKPPDYAEAFAEFAWRLAQAPVAARNLPRQVDFLVFERVVNRQEAHWMAVFKLGLRRQDGVRLRRLAAAFLRGANATSEVLDVALNRQVQLEQQQEGSTSQTQLEQQSLFTEASLESPAEIYVARLREAILRRLPGNAIVSNKEGEPDIVYVSDDGRKAIVEVKHRLSGALGTSEVMSAKSQLDRISEDNACLLVTNAPLSDEVRQHNASNPELAQGIEVVTWNDDRDDGLLARALMRILH
ncbi:hypothetical protein [Micromonospora sp. NPDC003816]|uniref:hypothetical protein n=1 Tax=Micromonospora sp. NPDC003816 TaxID=3364224 RepID=UPI0036998AED